MQYGSWWHMIHYLPHFSILHAYILNLKIIYNFIIYLRV